MPPPMKIPAASSTAATGSPASWIESYARLDESDDSEFYARERLVYHMDERARATLTRIIGTDETDGSIPFMDLAARAIDDGQLELLGLADYGSAADVNDDGNVDISDIQLIVNIISGE